MVNPITFRSSVAYNRKIEENLIDDSTNPMRLKANLSSLAAMSNYSQVLVNTKYDLDSLGVLKSVDELKKLMPKRLEIPHSFKVEDTNGERVYDKLGNLVCIREYKSDVMVEYYPSEDALNVVQILERDKNTGAVVTKIEPICKDDGSRKLNITVFDEELNNKYTMFQVEEDGAVSSITEFLGKGKSFRTLFRNPDTATDLRYIEAKEDANGDFVFSDCRLQPDGGVAEIKRTFANKDVHITYKDNKKMVDVKQKIMDE